MKKRKVISGHILSLQVDYWISYSQLTVINQLVDMLYLLSVVEIAWVESPEGIYPDETY